MRRPTKRIGTGVQVQGGAPRMMGDAPAGRARDQPRRVAPGKLIHVNEGREAPAGEFTERATELGHRYAVAGDHPEDRNPSGHEVSARPRGIEHPGDPHQHGTGSGRGWVDGGGDC